MRGISTIPPMGLSPRERGNHAAEVVAFVAHGSIPARAGEPNSTPALLCTIGVYPRASGGSDTH